MALGVEMFGERMFAGARRVAGDGGGSAMALTPEASAIVFRSNMDDPLPCRVAISKRRTRGLFDLQRRAVGGQYPAAVHESVDAEIEPLEVIRARAIEFA